MERIWFDLSTTCFRLGVEHIEREIRLLFPVLSVRIQLRGWSLWTAGWREISVHPKIWGREILKIWNFLWGSHGCMLIIRTGRATCGLGVDQQCSCCARRCWSAGANDWQPNKPHKENTNHRKERTYVVMKNMRTSMDKRTLNFHSAL